MTIVGKVLQVKGRKGIVEVEGEKREMDFSLFRARPGDFVSCASNIVVERLDEKEALAILNARKDLVEKR